MLCEMLKKTGVAGRPGSLFYDSSLTGWLDYYGLADTPYASQEEALAAVFAAAKHKGTSANGVFGVRLQQTSFPFFTQQLARLFPAEMTDRARIDAAFGPSVFIFLKREDKLGQAISRVVAEQSGLWHRNADGSEFERVAAHREPEFDRAAIATHLAELNQMEAAWEAWFAQQAISPMRFTYESLCEASKEALAKILEALGQDPAIAARIDPPTAKLANALSETWRDRFLNDQVER